MMENIDRGSEWHRWDLHVHTASSYDYKYKGPDADDLLCNALHKNNIEAVAITDHFKIDKDRIKDLREKAPDIVFFPGVELRTDKGANNLHLIIIFSDKENLEDLADDFNAIMIRQKAKSKESDTTIYWEFHDIVKFAKSHNGLISIHAGRKANGIDKEISNALPVKEAIKKDISDAVQFFEVGQKKDIKEYEKYVFKCIPRKPLIICSDNHSPNEYNVKEPLWIKARLTFDGLKQCIYQPKERIYIGTLPPTMERVRRNQQNNISSIACSRVEYPVNKDMNWFSFNVSLNPSMVAIIGNKGSGKSAFTDIIGHLCNCSTMKEASFLNNNRFRKMPKNYAKDYLAELVWLDGKKCQDTLSAKEESRYVEHAQYLPQRYIENVCNDFGDIFQKEISKVIFSYVDTVDRGTANDLEELVSLKSKRQEIGLQKKRGELKKINESIITIEQKMTDEYQKEIKDKLKDTKEMLERHEKSKPQEVMKPEQKDSNAEYQFKLNELNQTIKKTEDQIQKGMDEIFQYNNFIKDIENVIVEIDLLESTFNKIHNSIDNVIEKYNLPQMECSAELKTPRKYLERLVEKRKDDKNTLQKQINELKGKVQKLNEEKENLISSADSEEKQYQQYLMDLSEWEEKRNQIIGNENCNGSLKFFEREYGYIQNNLKSDYNEWVKKRDDITRQIYKEIIEISRIYQEIYKPIQGEITELLGSLEDGVQFQAEIFMKYPNLGQHLLDFINQRFNGKYGRSHNSLQEIETQIKDTDFGDENSVTGFTRDMAEVITSDFETAGKRVANRQEFYDFIFGLEYIGVNFQLKVNGHSLEELSPGERGIVLLIFYLALSKESKPIIIDQPEDNLDNQSIYSKLVPCICRAKQKRQVIIVTHNPNIAVACDAEQIIFCHKDPNTNQIEYVSGAIEDSSMLGHVIDVLEGTRPAFDLRRCKYN